VSFGEKTGVFTVDKPRVAIIILNWNGGQVTLDCLESLQSVQYEAFDTIVVDNDSSDNSPALIRKLFPWVTLIEMNCNLGFVEGNNVGIREAQNRGVDYVLLLNNDTVVEPDFLTRLVAVSQSDNNIGVVGPSIFYYDSPETIWSAGGSIDWQRGITKMLRIGETVKGEMEHEPRPVDFVTGCAMLVKMPAIRAAGLLDPRFFAYYEETEWCVRINRAGYNIVQVPDAKIWHKISIEARESSPTVHYYMTRNRLLFLKLVRAGIGPWIYTLVFDYFRTLLSWTFRPKWKHKQPQRKAMVQAILDYCQGKFGKLG
jgi:GT2 family glycosyltransferase